MQKVPICCNSYRSVGMTLLACKFSWEEQASHFLQSHESRGDVLLSSSESLSVNNTVGPIVACLGLEQSHEDFLFRYLQH